MHTLLYIYWWDILYLEGNVEGSAESGASLLSEAWHIVTVADIALLLSQSALIAETPAHADGTPYLGIYTDNAFQPMVVG